MSSRISTSVILVGLLGACGAAGDSVSVGPTTPSSPIATSAGLTTDVATTTTALVESVPVSAESAPITVQQRSPSVVTNVAATTEPPPPTIPPPTTPPPTAAQIPGSDQFPLHFTSMQDYSKGQIVRTVQERLVEWGYIDIVVDGQYGPATRDAVEQVQQRAGLVVDGLVGPKTYEVLIGPVLPPD